MEWGRDECVVNINIIRPYSIMTVVPPWLGRSPHSVSGKPPPCFSGHRMIGPLVDLPLLVPITLIALSSDRQTGHAAAADDPETLPAVSIHTLSEWCVNVPNKVDPTS
jgi:hypothetical protein